MYTECVHLVPSPVQSACNTAGFYYNPRVTDEAAARVIGVPPAVMTRVSRRAIAALYVISLWSMRSAEYLRATIGDVLPGDMLFIRGAKGSASYRINLPGIEKQVETARIQSPGRLVSGVTYIDLYRACVRIGVGSLLAGHANATRTHLSRHRLADTVRKYGESAASDLLHHRTATSIKYYGAQKEGYHGNHH